jgi:hypothetical protein
MPICPDCAWEADKKEPTAHEWLREAVQKWHNAGAVSAPFGHDACKGGTHCYCAHKPRGRWKGE